MDAATFFGTMSRLMAQNPPAPADAPIVNEIAKIGIAPGKTFDTSELPPAVASALQNVPSEAQEKIKGHRKSGGAADENGWLVMSETGDCLLKMKKYDEAEVLLRECLALSVGKDPAEW